jgi:hypothetical protein
MCTAYSDAILDATAKVSREIPRSFIARDEKGTIARSPFLYVRERAPFRDESRSDEVEEHLRS